MVDNKLKCFRHPVEDALYECGNCGNPICGECMRFSEDDDSVIFCPECTMEALIELSSEEYDSGPEPREDLYKFNLKAISGMDVQKIMNVKLLVILVLMIGVFLFASNYLSKRQPLPLMTDEIIQTAGNPILEMSFYLHGLFEYAQANKGNFPYKLDELYPKYVSKPYPNVLGGNDTYAFAAEAESGFVLSVPFADRFGFEKLYVTKNGIIKTK